MRTLIVILLVCHAQIASAQVHKLFLKSPSGKLELRMETTPDPDSPDNALEKVELHEAGKVVYNDSERPDHQPLIGVKWHQEKDALILLRHISKQVVIQVISRQSEGDFKQIEVEPFLEPFKDPPYFFRLVDAESTKKGFKCYILGRADRGDDDTAYCIEVDARTGKATLVSRWKMKLRDLPFLKRNVGNVLAEVGEQTGKRPPSYWSGYKDNEPAWFDYGSEPSER